jgi:ketosteroid isomerase-like protein
MLVILSWPHPCELAAYATVMSLFAHELSVFHHNHCMRKSKLQSVTVGGSADDIEAVFYEALQTGDIEKLMGCWADEDEVVCVHPGGPRVVGISAIRAAFDGMFSNGTIKATPQRVRKIESLASAVHNVLEKIEVLTEDGPREAYVIATNVYHKTAQGWRMVAHHASPGTPHEMQELSEAPMVLH